VAPGPAITFVADRGWGSMASCSRHLARLLGVRVLYTSVYSKGAALDGIGFLDPRSLLGIVRDLGFIRALRRLRGPVHFSNHHLARYGRFIDVPYVVTVHDLIRFRDMESGDGDVPLIRRPTRRDRFYFERDHEAIREATAVIATSEATKRDVVDILGVHTDRIHVVHNGIDQGLFQPTTKRVVPGPYVLFVGVEHPRKNLEGVLAALADLKRDRSLRSLRLVKVGAPGYRGRDFRRRTRRAIAEHGLEPDVDLVGWVDDALLPAYYSGAECLVMPSLYEGFGLPALEAMACECPVIVSDRGSLPEIVGDAALVTSPDPESIATAMRRLLQDSGLRRRLRGRGLARARRFSWEAAAARTMRVYEAVGEWLEPWQRRVRGLEGTAPHPAAYFSP
jgi:glycosyltransferase involved in cell wall biosynthesis